MAAQAALEAAGFKVAESIREGHDDEDTTVVVKLIGSLFEDIPRAVGIVNAQCSAFFDDADIKVMLVDRGGWFVQQMRRPIVS
jgi:hypothetical protein